MRHAGQNVSGARPCGDPLRLTRAVERRTLPDVAIPKGDKEGSFTYSDYLVWPDDERWELIHGVAYDMSPAPSRRHQGILAYVTHLFVTHLDGSPCSAYAAPFDVIFPESADAAPDEIDTVVQPDLVVVCDSAKLTRQGCTGAPDFVLEILSPTTAFKDMEEKLRLYESHGVREYWILNPANDTLMVYAVAPREHKPGYQKPVLFTSDDTVAPQLFPGLSVGLGRVFDRDREPS